MILFKYSKNLHQLGSLDGKDSFCRQVSQFQVERLFFNTSFYNSIFIDRLALSTRRRFSLMTLMHINILNIDVHQCHKWWTRVMRNRDTSYNMYSILHCREAGGGLVTHTWLVLTHQHPQQSISVPGYMWYPGHACYLLLHLLQESIIRFAGPSLRYIVLSLV